MPSLRRTRRSICAFILGLFVFCITLAPRPLFAWGDEGHEIIALVADRFLDPAVREKIAGSLAADTGGLTLPDIASEATWADRYRYSDRNGSRQHYEQTHQWHFVDIELGDPNLDRACFGHPPLPAETVASNGPARACVVDRIEQFATELADPRTDPEERLVALKFVLHLVGDLHQPLHAANDHDAGGNRKQVAADGFRPGNLHHFWDTEWARRLGDDPQTDRHHIDRSDFRRAAAGMVSGNGIGLGDEVVHCRPPGRLWASPRTEHAGRLCAQ